MSRQEAYTQYLDAVRAGKTYNKNRLFRQPQPGLRVLDELLDPQTPPKQVDLGVVEIPMERIIGTKTRSRAAAFTGNFMPLLHPSTEFGDKWINVCEILFSENGELDPITCYEYLGWFYVAEGNKRVSVLKSLGSENISGHVLRLIPARSENPGVQRYYEFLEAYALCGTYQVWYTQSGGFQTLQEALGFRPDHVWTRNDQRSFFARQQFFRRAYEKLGGCRLSLTVTDALLIWLRRYPFDQLCQLSQEELMNSLRGVWLQIQMTDLHNRLTQGTVTEKELRKWNVEKTYKHR